MWQLIFISLESLSLEYSPLPRLFSSIHCWLVEESCILLWDILHSGFVCCLPLSVLYSKILIKIIFKCFWQEYSISYVLGTSYHIASKGSWCLFVVCLYKCWKWSVSSGSDIVKFPVNLSFTDDHFRISCLFGGYNMVVFNSVFFLYLFNWNSVKNFPSLTEAVWILWNVVRAGINAELFFRVRSWCPVTYSGDSWVMDFYTGALFPHFKYPFELMGLYVFSLF